MRPAPHKGLASGRHRRYTKVTPNSASLESYHGAGRLLAVRRRLRIHGVRVRRAARKWKGPPGSAVTSPALAARKSFEAHPFHAPKPEKVEPESPRLRVCLRSQRLGKNRPNPFNHLRRFPPKHPSAPCYPEIEHRPPSPVLFHLCPPSFKSKRIVAIRRRAPAPSRLRAKPSLP